MLFCSLHVNPPKCLRKFSVMFGYGPTAILCSVRSVRWRKICDPSIRGVELRKRSDEITELNERQACSRTARIGELPYGVNKVFSVLVAIGLFADGSILALFSTATVITHSQGRRTSLCYGGRYFPLWLQRVCLEDGSGCFRMATTALVASGQGRRMISML